MFGDPYGTYIAVYFFCIFMPFGRCDTGSDRPNQDPHTQVQR